MITKPTYTSFVRLKYEIIYMAHSKSSINVEYNYPQSFINELIKARETSPSERPKLQDRKGRKKLSEWCRRGEWAGIVDGEAPPSSALPSKVLSVHNHGRGWSEIYCGHSLKDRGHTGEAGSC